ncbi:MAG: hypothetical protein KDK44_02695 [Chlamydiia bacterium]|nr:hypothetical protein [Chlamydiia bacterium]MCP5509544.1 hypothetical protein [Chlamydiales bacterium]HPE85111.1 hypothetical protein [Chlamydiales bacterium]
MKTALLVIGLSVSCILLGKPLDRQELISHQSNIIDHSNIGPNLVISLLVRGAAYLENGEIAQATDDLNAAKNLVSRLPAANQSFALENIQILSGYINKHCATKSTHAILQCSLSENFAELYTVEYWECNRCSNIFLSRPTQCGCGSISFARKYSSTDAAI